MRNLVLWNENTDFGKQEAGVRTVKCCEINKKRFMTTEISETNNQNFSEKLHARIGIFEIFRT